MLIVARRSRWVLKISAEAVAATNICCLKPCPSIHLLTAHKIFPTLTRMKAVMAVVGVQGWPVEVRFGSLES